MIVYRRPQTAQLSPAFGVFAVALTAFGGAPTVRTAQRRRISLSSADIRNTGITPAARRTDITPGTRNTGITPDD